SAEAGRENRKRPRGCCVDRFRRQVVPPSGEGAVRAKRHIVVNTCGNSDKGARRHGDERWALNVVATPPTNERSVGANGDAVIKKRRDRGEGSGRRTSDFSNIVATPGH